jgi:hypothetical protein
MATDTPLLTRLREMNIGDKVTVSIDTYGYNTVRRYACDLGVFLDRRYSTHVNRADRTYTVTRLS